MNPFPVSHWGGEAAFTASPTFYAPLINTLVPTTAPGGSGLTFGRAQAAYVEDHENLLKLADGDEARFTGARRVKNMLAKSEAVNDAAWSKVTATIGTGVADPLSGTSAFTITATAGGAVVYQGFASTTATSTASCWIRRRTGSGTIRLYANAAGAGTGVAFTLTGSWQRFSITQSVTATARYFMLEIVTNADAIDVWHPQYEDVTGQSNQNPSEYVSSGVLSSPYHGANVDAVKYFNTLNGNTVASNIVTEATGALITSSNSSPLTTDASVGPFGLLVEGGRAQLMTGVGETFGSWNLTRATVTSNTTAGPNGFATADTLNEDSSTNTHFCFLTVAKVGISATYTASVYVKPSGRSWVAFDAIDGGAGYAEAFFNVSTGTVGAVSSAGGGFTFISASIRAAANGFYRCIMTFTSSTAVLIGTAITSADGDGDSTTVGLNGAALILWGHQLEDGAFATSFMSGTRAYDGFTYNSFTSNASATVGTAYAETKTLWTTAAAAYPLLAFGTATLYPLYNNSEASTVIRTNDGTNNVGKTGLADTSTAVRKLASSWTASVLAVTGSGATAATGTFDGDMGSTGIGIGTPTTGSGIVWNGNIRNVKLYTSAATAGQLAALTA